MTAMKQVGSTEVKSDCCNYVNQREILKIVPCWQRQALKQAGNTEVRSGCCKFYVNQSKGHKKVQRWQQEALKQAVNTQVRSDCCKSKREPRESAALATTSSTEVRSDCCKSKREPSSRAGPGPAFLLWLCSPCTPTPTPSRSSSVSPFHPHFPISRPTSEENHQSVSWRELVWAEGKHGTHLTSTTDLQLSQ